MGNGAFSRAAGCFVPAATHDRKRAVTIFLPASEPSDEGLGHSFCYVRPSPFPLDSPPPSFDSQLPVTESTTAAEKVRNLSETSFKAISGASVSANTSTPRTVVCSEHFHSFTGVPDNRHAAFESTASFTSLPLQPIPRGPASGPSSGVVFSGGAVERGFLSGPIERNLMSGPLERGFMSGPLERSFMSGPLEKGFMSGPLDKGFMSGPVDFSTDKSHFSAPLTGPYYYLSRRLRRRMSAARFVSTMREQAKGVLTRTLSKTSSSLAWTHKSFVPSVKQLIQRGFYSGTRESVSPCDTPSDLGCPSADVPHNLQWAQGKAGEDRVQVVVSEEHGWLFIGIYDGFSGPDAPDFLMRNLYRSVNKELQGLLWDQHEVFGPSDEENKGCLPTAVSCSDFEGCIEKGHDSLARHRDSYAPEPTKLNNTLLEHCKHPDDQSGLFKSTDVPSIDCNGSFKRRSTFKQLMEREDLDVISSYSESKFVCNKSNSASSIVRCQTDGGTGDSRTDSDAVSASGSGVITRTPDDVSRANRPRTWKSKLSFQSTFRLKQSKKTESHEKSLPPRCHLMHMEGTSNKFHSGLKKGDFALWRQNSADHSSVLKALARALEETEGAFLDMADRALPENPELALMGSCILVVLMKDKDVYVMNVGDSRAILAQYRTPENGLGEARSVCSNGESSTATTKSGDLALRLDLGCDNLVASDGLDPGAPTSSSSLHALQLSKDHSTSVEEEITRIKSEHLDDSCCILNDRVKGSLKVTRAFGAGFLKKPRWNDALLKRFQVDYVGSAPYISCMPALHHHRLGPYDQFLVLSSDGLYQYFTNEEVVSHVEWFMEKFPEGDPAQHLIEQLLFRAAKKAGMDFHELLDIPQGDRRKYHDDVSVMIISLEGRIWRSWG